MLRKELCANVVRMQPYWVVLWKRRNVLLSRRSGKAVQSPACFLEVNVRQDRQGIARTAAKMFGDGVLVEAVAILGRRDLVGVS